MQVAYHDPNEKMKDEWNKITLHQLNLPLEMVEGFFISNAVTLTAKRRRNISTSVQYPNELLKFFRADGIEQQK